MKMFKKGIGGRMFKKGIGGKMFKKGIGGRDVNDAIRVRTPPSEEGPPLPANICLA